jgi:hypothetical protein
LVLPPVGAFELGVGRHAPHWPLDGGAHTGYNVRY